MSPYDFSEEAGMDKLKMNPCCHKIQAKWSKLWLDECLAIKHLLQNAEKDFKKAGESIAHIDFIVSQRSRWIDEQNEEIK